MGKIRAFSVQTDNDQTVYYPGQEVKGTVIIDLEEQTKMNAIVLECRGKARVQWNGGEESRFEKRNYFHYTSLLFGEVINALESDAEDYQPQSTTIHPAGYHTYPFHFVLPPDIPASITAQHGFVKYWVHAFIDRPWKKDEKAEAQFNVVRVIDVNMYPKLATPVVKEASKDLGFCCLPGPVTATISLTRTGFVPGEYIEINGEITNMSRSEIGPSKIFLCKETIFSTATVSNYEDEYATTLLIGQRIAPGRTELWNRKHLHIPPLPPTTTMLGGLIQVSYNIGVHVTMSGWYEKLAMKFPVIIGTVPFRQIVSAGNAQSAPSISTADVGHSETTQPPLTCALDGVEEGEVEDIELRDKPKYPLYTWETGTGPRRIRVHNPCNKKTV